LLYGIVSQGSFSAYGSTLPCHNPDQISGDSVLVLRPEEVRITAAATSANPLLVGTIIETHFYGGSSSTTVRVPGVDHAIVASHPGAPQYIVGDQVGLSWDPQSAVLLQVNP